MNFNQFVDGISTFFIGVTIVFVTLVLLIIAIRLISKIVAFIENASKKEPVAIQVQPVAAKPVKLQKTDELELVAVITAAIAASMGTTSDKLQVKSLRKVERKTR